MGLIRVASACFRKYIDVSGRANRREFWFWIAFCAILLFIATIIDGILIAPALGHIPFEQEAGRPLATFTLLLLLSPTITAAVRRFHDSNLSGWWFFLLLVLPVGLFAIQLYFPGTSILQYLTALSAIPLAYFLVKGARKEENRFG